MDSWMQRLSPKKEQAFPLLVQQGYEVKSDETWDYNCIAFAADVENDWWWPDEHGEGFWPAGVDRKVELAAFVKAYETLGYTTCDHGLVEEGHEKIVIYERNGKPTHAAKQTADGRWKSKLGPWEDILHNTTLAVETWADVGIYGKASIFMRRKLRTI
jgi:hypothetical protein